MTYLRWLARLLAFPFLVVYDMVRHAIPLLWDILTPGSNVQAGFIEVPLRSSTAMEFTLISNLIALTPGTVTVALRATPPVLWAHGIYIHDHDEFVREIRALEARVLGVTRLHGAHSEAGPGQSGWSQHDQDRSTA